MAKRGRTKKTLQRRRAVSEIEELKAKSAKAVADGKTEEAKKLQIKLTACEDAAYDRGFAGPPPGS
jgi:hypothetical protein